MPFKDNIIGHQNIIQMLQQQMRNNHLPHALLFTGPEGIGKKLTAMGLGKALLCNKMKNDYCDVCTSCHTINESNHPDVTVIQPEGNSIKIDQMREWQNTLDSKSYLGSWRITIVDDSEKMTQSAANSILKVLEEPPQNTLICLIALEAGDILPTIISRCQIIRFSPLSRSEFSQVLTRLTNMTNAQAGLIYHLSKGRLSKALSMDINYISNLREKWIGLLNYGCFDENVDIKKDQSSLLEGLNVMAYWIRDIELLQLGLEDSFLTNQDMLKQLRKEAYSLSNSIIHKRIILLLETIEAIERNANPKLAIDYLFSQWDRKSQSLGGGSFV